MAKRELSTTLKNLKFMQRAAQKDDKSKKEEEVLPAGDFASSGAVSAVKRCVVVVEGDPHPGVCRGRMSFLSFNPSIDKLNDVASDSAATSSDRQNEATSIRENGAIKYRSENVELDASSGAGNGDYKRKQGGVALEAQYPNKSRKNYDDNQDSTPNSSSSQKQHKREKLDWSVLRPPKYETKKR
ncbi:scarecrow-like transcription factor 11 [Striga asiatica]|uniref:Scarecrow-like transcription factor 11 n=1 Tax=Striga asiatica TaxID=4170 RepID=A0A5A7QMQ4_STRAF|nr:scarecrow-like transcription factor 11 [Striga asiatica]